jgi:hypothetical protein
MSVKVETTDQKKKTEEKKLDTGGSYRVAEAQTEKKTEERRCGKGASKSGSGEDVCYCSSNLLKCYKHW